MNDAISVAESQPAGRKRPSVKLDPLLVMLGVLIATAFLTHVLPAGKFDRVDGRIVPGSYQTIAKVDGLQALASSTAPSGNDKVARAAGPVAIFMAIPAGMAKAAVPIFMVMSIGGLFGILQATGAIQTGIDRLLNATSGNARLLIIGLMALLAGGSTFLGTLTEYLAIVPVICTLGDRLKLPTLFAAAVVLIAGNVGYAASVTNPIVLSVAQPLVGLPILSGGLTRLAIFAVLLGLGVAYVLWWLRKREFPISDVSDTKLSGSHLAVLLSLLLLGIVMVAGTIAWEWGAAEHTALFLAFSIAMGTVSNLPAATASAEFMHGMRTMLLPAMLIGLGRSIEILLSDSQVIDTIVYGFAVLIDGRGAGAVAIGILTSQMAFDVLLQSTATKAAISLPILNPIAHLADVNPHVSVTALTLASGLTNLITPTNSALLAFLAASKVDYASWLRFIFPLFCILIATSAALLLMMV